MLPWMLEYLCSTLHTVMLSKTFRMDLVELVPGSVTQKPFSPFSDLQGSPSPS